MDKGNQCYTIITFAPIQAFIEKSRKLRDLYGSSYILSFLSWIICLAAKKQGYEVVSPALPNVTQGMPNQIVLRMNLSSEDIQAFKQDLNPYSDNIQAIEQAFNQGWKCLVDSCREWIEQEVKERKAKDAQGIVIPWDYCWRRDWQLWTHHCWEFFVVQGKAGESITDARQQLNQVKNSRDWTGINWQGESSTLSGTDAIAYPSLGRKSDPRNYNYQQEKTTVKEFYQQLSEKLGESFIEPREELSIPELIKRLITHEVVVDVLVKHLRGLQITIAEDEAVKMASYFELKQIAWELKPESFRDLNRHKSEDSPKKEQKAEGSKKEGKYWTGWFLGDGDSASKYFKKFAKPDAKLEEAERLTNAKLEAEKLTEFSTEMRKWGKDLRTNSKKYLQEKGRMIYAGGDDFLGVLYYPNKPISPHECLNWFYTFKSEIWHKPQEKKISASVGFVWAGNQVPQRDVLQHCHLAETFAKSTGRDRIAFRILFNSGNYLEWVCPWWLLDLDDLVKQAEIVPSLSKPSQNLIESYRDRNHGNNWTHFYQDVAILESRHAFTNKSIDIALGLIEIYFDSDWKEIITNRDNWWNLYDQHELQTFTGILGDPKRFNPDYQENTQMRAALNTNSKVLGDFNNWVINLAKVGFHLTDNYGRTN